MKQPEKTHRFVKVHCNHYDKTYPEWFLVVSPENPLNLLESINFQDRHTDVIKAQFYDHGMPNKFTEEGGAIAHALIRKNYTSRAAFLSPYNDRTWLVRESGTYMPMDSSHTIVREVCSNSLIYPTVDADMIICENDPVNRYLKGWERGFPQYKVHSLNHFSKQTPEAIHSAFISAKVIAFHTTFTDFGWWGKLIQGWLELKGRKPKVIGYCEDRKRWNLARKMVPEGMELEYINYYKL